MARRRRVLGRILPNKVLLVKKFLRWARMFYAFSLLVPLYSFPLLLPSANATSSSAPHFTFAVAGDWGGITNSSNTSGSPGWMVVKKIASLGYSPNFTIALGDLGYSDQNPRNWCGNFTRISPRMVFITGNHDTLNSTSAINYNDGTSVVPKDALTSEKADGLSGFLDPVTGMNGYVNACPPPSASGIAWEGSGNNVSSNRLSCLTTLAAPSCYGREYYFDYPASNPIMRFIQISAGICGPWFNGCPQNATYAGWKAPTPPATCANPPPPGSEHYCWLKARIDEAKNEGLWIGVSLHKQCISDDGNGCESTFDPFNLTMIEMGGVDLWLDGHDHTYQRSYQLTTPCHLNSTTSLASCTVPPNAGSGSGKDPSNPPYVRGAGTVVNVIGTGGRPEDSLCPFSPTHNCPNQGQFVKLCGSEGPISGVTQTSGCLSGGDHGFTYFNVTTNQINATYVSITSSFTDSYVIKVPNPPGAFSVSVNPTIQTVRAGLDFGPSGSSGYVTVNLNSFGHFAGTINLAASVSAGQPKTCSIQTCPTVQFSPGSVQVPDGGNMTSTLLISTSLTTPCGNSTYPETFTIIVTATSSSVPTRTVAFTIYVFARGDVTLDGKVNIFDLTSVGGIFGATANPPSAGWNPSVDLNTDGRINIFDLSLVGGDFGQVC